MLALPSGTDRALRHLGNSGHFLHQRRSDKLEVILDIVNMHLCIGNSLLGRLLIREVGFLCPHSVSTNSIKWHLHGDFPYIAFPANPWR